MGASLGEHGGPVKVERRSALPASTWRWSTPGRV